MYISRVYLEQGVHQQGVPRAGRVPRSMGAVYPGGSTGGVYAIPAIPHLYIPWLPPTLPASPVRTQHVHGGISAV